MFEHKHQRGARTQVQAWAQPAAFQILKTRLYFFKILYILHSCRPGKKQKKKSFSFPKLYVYFTHLRPKKNLLGPAGTAKEPACIVLKIEIASQTVKRTCIE